MAILSISTSGIANGTLTPLSGTTPTSFSVTVTRFDAVEDAMNVTLDIAPVPGLSFSGHDAIHPASNRLTKSFNVIVTLADTVEFSDGYAEIEIIGLNNMPDGYTFNGVTQKARVNILDGWHETRAIPLSKLNFAEFNPYANTTNGLMRHFELTEDIELTGENNWNAIGSGNDQFSGSFNGHGHIITGLNINSPDTDMQGMFGRIGYGSIVKNVGLLKAYVLGGREVGGIAGYNEGTVKNCFVSGEVLGISTVGGVVGSNIYAALDDCYSLCKVSGSSGAVGGIAGQNYGGTVKHCYSTGDIQGRGIVGGIVGNTVGQYAETSDCIALNSGITTTGGYEYAGRVSGGNSGTLDSNYALVTTQISYNKNLHKSVESNETGIDGKDVSPSNIKTLNMWQTAGFTFGDEYWIWEDFNYLPHLFARDLSQWPKMSGSGTSDDPFWVYDVETLQKVLSKVDGWDGDSHYIQLAHIDMKDKSLSNRFTVVYISGCYDGNLYTISNLSINLPDNSAIGAFGCVGEGGVLKNLGLLNVNVTARFQVGGIVGQNRGIVSNCYATGIVSGSEHVGGAAGICSGRTENCYFQGTVKGGESIGGIIGLAFDNAVTLNCYASGEVIAEHNCAGGIIGLNYGTISKCFSRSNISGRDTAGGIAGFNNQLIESCYSEGSINVDKSDGFSLSGGIVGDFNAGTVKNCYSTCNITAKGGAVGGAIGYIDSRAKAEFCYATGEIVANNHLSGAVGYAKASLVVGCIALNKYISKIESDYSNTSRVVITEEETQISKLYSRSDLPIYDNGRTSGSTKKIDPSMATTSGDDGQNVKQGTGSDQYNNIAFWKGIGFDFNEVWVWDSAFVLHNGAKGLPKLREAGLSPLIQLDVVAVAPSSDTEKLIESLPDLTALLPKKSKVTLES